MALTDEENRERIWRERYIADVKRYTYCCRNYEGADLRGKDLSKVNFTGANLRGANLSDCDLRNTTFVCADLSLCVMKNANASRADFSGADLTNSYLRGTIFDRAKFWHTCLKGVIAKNASFVGANLTGADICRAEMLGARFDYAITRGLRNIDRAIFVWFLNPMGGKPSYDPFPGAIPLVESITGKESFQENSGMTISGRGYLPEMELA